MQGTLRKMTTRLASTVEYALPLGEEALPLNAQLGQSLTLTHTGQIFCLHCGKKTKKSFSQGHCFPCMKKLASCDLCIMKPETCHYHLGTCREPSWGEANCFTPHVVYLANTSALKVGITRESQVPTRWMDQGATQALPIYRVKTRQLSGLVEVALAKHVSDKTNWRTLLKGNGDPMDLSTHALELLPNIAELLERLADEHGEEALEPLSQDSIDISYPVLEFPKKITSHNFDKTPEVSGTLMGIKGQYLLFDTGVINIRKFGGYEVAVS